MKTAFSYIRFSSLAQAAGSSLNRQLEAAKAYAKSNGLRLAMHRSALHLRVLVRSVVNREGFLSPGSARDIIDSERKFYEGQAESN